MSKKQKIRVGFTKEQHDKVNAFLEFIKPQVIKDFGNSVQVTVDWSEDNDIQKPHVKFEGGGLQKVIPLKEILEADDNNLPAPVLRVIDGGKIQ